MELTLAVRQVTAAQAREVGEGDQGREGVISWTRCVPRRGGIVIMPELRVKVGKADNSCARASGHDVPEPDGGMGDAMLSLPALLAAPWNRRSGDRVPVVQSGWGKTGENRAGCSAWFAVRHEGNLPPTAPT